MKNIPLLAPRRVVAQSVTITRSRRANGRQCFYVVGRGYRRELDKAQPRIHERMESAQLAMSQAATWLINGWMTGANQ